jgi:hypothetical protein
VKENDTMFGLAIRLDVSEQFLRNINGLSGSLYPGMVFTVGYIDNTTSKRY